MQLRRTLIGVLALFGALAMPGVADATPGITAVGTLERFPQEAVDAFGPEVADPSFNLTTGTLLPVLEAGQLWQIYLNPSHTRTYVLVRDADSRQVTGTFTFQGAIDRGGPAFGGEWLHATDGGRHVYVVVAREQIVEIDTTTFTVRNVGPVDIVFTVAALTYDHETGDLLVLYGGPGAFFVANRLTVIQRIDPDTGQRASRVIRSCTGPLPGTGVGSDTYAPELLLRPDAVYVTCQTTTTANGDDTHGLVVRLPRTSLWEFDGAESSVPVGLWVDSALVDPDSGRIAVLGVLGDVTVVDAPAMSVVGTFRVVADDFAPVGAGLDRAAGRFFFQSHLGFGYVDLRSTPLLPPTIDPAAAAGGKERIVPDGDRVYVLPGYDSPFEPRADRYTIYNVAS